MRKHVFALWLLNRSVPKSHAESLLGDLLESSKGDPAQLRIVLARTLWSLHWRSVAGVAAAAVLGGIALAELQVVFFEAFWAHHGSAWQQAWGSTLALIAGSFAFLASFCAVKFGIRDKLMQLALGLALCGASASSFMWTPGVPMVSGICAAGLLVCLVRSREGRAALKALGALTALQPLLWFGGLTVLMSPLAMVLKHTHVELDTVRPFLAAYLTFAYGGLVLTVSWMCLWVHRWAFRLEIAS